MSSLSSVSSSSSSSFVPPSGAFIPGLISQASPFSRLKVSRGSAFRPVGGYTVSASNQKDNCVDAAPPQHNVVHASSADIVSTINRLASFLTICHRRLSLQEQGIRDERTSSAENRRKIQELENTLKRYKLKQEKRNQIFKKQIKELKAKNAQLSAQNAKLVELATNTVKTIGGFALSALATSDTDE